MLVDDPKRDEEAPAFSPDGASIAFDEADDDGGIFIAGATGESVRRLTDFGFHPAWSPDGTRIAFSTEKISDPSSRQGVSRLYVVDVSGGAPKKIVDGDAAQPAWSPDGQRIVYWSNTGGQRDIYTVAASGGSRTAVTDDAALDWSPAWSPDGDVYFSSDRGGSMNLWRVRVDEKTGRVNGQPSPVTVGVVASAALPSFSKDGSRIAFRSRVFSVNPLAIPFDPATNRAGTPVVLDASNNVREPSAVSPDGSLIAYFSIGDRQEDLFLSAPDGSGMRRVTDDAARDRGPHFTPDGASLVFYSNRDGHWGIWSIRTDGSNLHKLLGSAGQELVDPVLSPAGDKVAFVDVNAPHPTLSVCTIADGRAGVPQDLPDSSLGSVGFTATSWSPDGARLAGMLASGGGRDVGVGVYDLAARKLRQVAPDSTGGVTWLRDSRRIVYLSDQDSRLFIVDTVTGTRTVIDLRLPGPALSDMFAVAPDDKTIYYGAVNAESDIWILERK